MSKTVSRLLTTEPLCPPPHLITLYLSVARTRSNLGGHWCYYLFTTGLSYQSVDYLIMTIAFRLMHIQNISVLFVNEFKDDG